MRRFMGLFVALLLVASCASAEPNWFVRHKRFLTMVGVGVASSAVAAKGLQHCRRGDVENCTGHYGAAWGTYGVQQAALVALPIILAESCWKHESFSSKACYAIAYVPMAGNFAWGANEWHQYAPEKDANTGLTLKRDWLYDLRHH